jgi:hypothetical protein
MLRIHNLQQSYFSSGNGPILKVKKPGNIFSDGQSLLQIFCQKDVSTI